MLLITSKENLNLKKTPFFFFSLFLFYFSLKYYVLVFSNPKCLGLAWCDLVYNTGDNNKHY